MTTIRTLVGEMHFLKDIEGKGALMQEMHFTIDIEGKGAFYNAH